MGLPEADAATKAWFIAWLEGFSAYLRAVDYASARPLFHPEILAFGTHKDVLPSLDAWVSTQWDNVWPRTDDFRFTIPETHVLVSGDQSISGGFSSGLSTGTGDYKSVSAINRDASMSNRHTLLPPLLLEARPDVPAFRRSPYPMGNK